MSSSRRGVGVVGGGGGVALETGGGVCGLASVEV